MNPNAGANIITIFKLFLPYPPLLRYYYYYYYYYTDLKLIFFFLGGDGLVAARHLHLMGYKVSIHYPRKSAHPHLQRLELQLHNLGIPFLDSLADVTERFKKSNHVVDALFGFSFKPPIRDPFGPVVALLIEHSMVKLDLEQKSSSKGKSAAGGEDSWIKPVVTAVDVPSSWNVDTGPLLPTSNSEGGVYVPDVLVSLTCPKKAAEFFKGRHFVGGRFVSKEFAEKWGFDLPDYEGIDQVAEVFED